jgi:hypothetical protein
VGFLSKLFGDRAGGESGTAAIGHSLPDDEWLAESRRIFDATIDQHYGSPESMAEPAKKHYGHQNFGVAMFFYGKSIDMLQTAYGFSGMADRQPSPADAWIVDGYVSSIGAGLAMHPNAPVAESATTTIGLLQDIAAECERVGAPHQLYSNAAEQVAFEARNHLAG